MPRCWEGTYLEDATPNWPVRDGFFQRCYSGRALKGTQVCGGERLGTVRGMHMHREEALNFSSGS